jgi:cyclic beta-1,2-glucan synthetase
VRLLKLMNPVENARDPKAVERYRGEPYVVAADVSSAPGRAGQSGWTWYTGSAGWMYRIWIEEVLGFKLRGDRLTVVPVIPDDWPGFEMTYRYGKTTYEIAVRRRGSNDPGVIELDGRRCADTLVQLNGDGGVHKITVWIPQRSALPTNRPQGRPIEDPAPNVPARALLTGQAPVPATSLTREKPVANARGSE